MHLYLSSSSPLRSTFSNAEDQVLFKVETPVCLGTLTSSISYVVPNDSDPNGSLSMQDKFAHLGQVEHKTKDYFRKEGWGPYGCGSHMIFLLRHRVFTASDGREYKWLLQALTSKLIINDGTKTLVAYFHRRGLRVIGKPKRASLQIFASGAHIVHEILITFIYVEKIRNDRERALAS
ncbi:hypothetical protein H0H81_005447 [Sphagnurus paluster]|uniref:DUF6593 domain-containing protein n=1 Tax=Sphagnurus paluster TaxID=117069 RepID=A0A9P7FTX2_9AGAR|nr:hypothetical protein H0H81_005447 [Sphagnurus paluster]